MPFQKTFLAGQLQQTVPTRQFEYLSRQPSRLEKYQILLARKLSSLFPCCTVKTEWAAMAGEIGLYSPQLDIAVGPFATHQSYIEEYNRLMDDSQQFVEQIIVCQLQNIMKYDGEGCDLSFAELRDKNPNARCFLAVEIENAVSRKHLIGGAVNAAALGRIGLAVAWTPEKLKAFVKLRKYLGFLASVRKNTFDTTNLLILSSDQLLKIVKKALQVQANTT